jgi:hypothetical protein
VELVVSLKPIRIGDVAHGLGVPVELDLDDYLRMLRDWFLPLVSSEIEELNLNLRQLKLTISHYELERVLQLADYLNVTNIVTRPTGDAESMIEVMDAAASYGMRMIWELRKPIQHADFFEELAAASSPHRLRVALHVARESSLRGFIKDMVQLGGHVSVVYFSNKKGSNQGLPIFNGVIDYLKVTKVLHMLRYDEAVVLRYRPDYYTNYITDSEALSNFMNSLGAGIPDKSLTRSLERIMNEVINEATNR